MSVVDVEVTEVPQEIVAVVSRTVPMDELSAFYQEVLPRVAAAVARSGGALAGPPFGWYRGMPGATIEVSAGFPISGDRPDPGDDVVVTQRPGGRAAVTEHVGSYDGLRGTWDRLWGWVGERSLETRGDCWEEYLTEATGDPSTWRTRVVVPLR